MNRRPLRYPIIGGKLVRESLTIENRNRTPIATHSLRRFRVVWWVCRSIIKHPVRAFLVEPTPHPSGPIEETFWWRWTRWRLELLLLAILEDSSLSIVPISVVHVLFLVPLPTRWFSNLGIWDRSGIHGHSYLNHCRRSLLIQWWRIRY
jgi:hypothetical protein